MSSQQPLVSICIPVYNVEEYIDESLQCCLNQTYQNIEIIISNNCSTDRTIEKIKAYNDPRIRIYSNDSNLGMLGNYKKVLTYATGKYITFLCADDGMELDTIEKALAIMESPKYSNVVLVNTYMNIINNVGKVVFTRKFIFGGGLISKYWAIRSNFLVGTNALGEPNAAVFRKEAYDKIPEPKFHNCNNWTPDLDMKIELALHGSIYVIPEPLGRFRLSDTSTSNKELRFTQAMLFKQYAMNIYRDKRYNLSFYWVLHGTVAAVMMQIARNVFYKLFIVRKKAA